MTAFHVDLDEVALVISRMAAVGDDLSSLAARLDASSGRLHEAWSGVASSAHLSAHAEFAAGFAEMRAALADMHTAADTARSNYSGAVDANLAMWGDLA